MFDDNDMFSKQKNNRFRGFPDLINPDKNSNFIEPQFKPNSPNKFLFQPKLEIEKPDWTPDFSESFDIVGDSINLALHTLGMGKNEYNSSNVSSLKSQRRIDCSREQIWALNILIYYKKNTNSNLPDLSPIKHTNLSGNGWYEF